MEYGTYSVGKKDGTWKKYYDDGKLLLSITYKEGFEIEYNGVPVDIDINKSDIDPEQEK